ncbi:sigma 54-interacting transcriptional regulator [Desulfococcaceae bacterium OttesenSCG-928-F15]|nr:sigma 54-interacting transcriptional regulator [Desulfococcaceae bacterium OttesenSCG-928-F15]
MPVSLPRASGSFLAYRLQNRNDWPLSARLFLRILPPGVFLCLVAAWFGYHYSFGALMESVAAVPMMEAQMQAEQMRQDLEQLRKALERIAQGKYADETVFSESLRFHLQDKLSIIAEFGYKTHEGEGAIFFREDERFIAHRMQKIAQGIYSASQQLLSQPVSGKSAAIFPAVYSQYVDAQKNLNQIALMRMAIRAPGTNDILFLGIDLKAWVKSLSVFVSEHSPMRLPIQQGAFQLSYFFDLHGWILFEMTNLYQAENVFPDMVRRGFGGDLGRPGLDSVFRPTASDLRFWEMVMDIRNGKAGRQPASAKTYIPAHNSAWATLCYVPVLFSPSEESEPVILGGLAFIESSPLPKALSYRIMNILMGIGGIALLVFFFLLFRASRLVTRPIARMIGEMTAMHDNQYFSPISIAPACAEHQNLQTAINGVILTSMGMQKELEHLKSERHLSLSQLPVDLKGMTSAPAFNMEYGLVGSGKAMRGVREQILKAARTKADVLVWGETGTGKELVASAIHHAGSNSSGPFISINCGALDENLLLDTLFGHVKGAFSEAKGDRKGVFLAAEGGTLHLDEIGNASLKVQQSLLRTLAVRRIRPLGTDTEVAFNTRVVAATNVDLREYVRRGAFREDLYYRLAIITVKTPALREHKEDIPELASYYIHDAAKQLGIAEPHLSKGALEILMDYGWPGNVREFRNCLTRAVAFVDGDIILSRHIALEYDSYGTAPGTEAESASAEAYSEPVRSLPLTEKKGAPDLSEKKEAPSLSEDLPFPTGFDEKLMGEMNRRQRQALQIIIRQGGITRARYGEIVGQSVSARTAQSDLRQLVEWNILERKGAGPATYYVLKKES